MESLDVASSSGVTADDKAAGRGDVDRFDSRGCDKKQPLSTESSSIYGSRTCGSELYSQKPRSPNLKIEKNGKRYCNGELNMILSLPKQDGKVVPKRSIKMLTSIPCPKRRKMDQGKLHDESKVKGHEDIQQKISSDTTRCTSSEKIKQKRCCDPKRIDKKGLKCGTRGKSDCLSSKSGSIDPAIFGHNILGTNGFKSDFRDITNNLEELSLNELLDGSYTYLSVCREKRKRALQLKNELLLSVGNACSILSLNAADSHSSRRDFIQNTNITNHYDDNKRRNESASWLKGPSGNLTLYEPRDVLERIGLSLGQNTDLPLSTCSVASGFSKCSVNNEDFSDASLPPFPWSNSQSGLYRPSVDSAKASPARIISQGQWARLIGNSTPKISEDTSKYANNRKLLHEIESLKESIGDPCEKRDCSFWAQLTPAASFVQDADSDKDYLKNFSNLVDASCSKSSAAESKSNPRPGRGICDVAEDAGCSSLGSAYSISSQASIILPRPDVSKEVLCAAEILCDLASCAYRAISQGYSNGTIKWPKSPSQKSMKARKPSSSAKDGLVGSCKTDMNRNGYHSTKFKSSERKNGCNLSNGSGKGTIRWPVPVNDSSSPSRSEKALALGSRNSNNGDVRQSSHASHPQTVRDYENEQRLRKAVIMQSSSSFAGNCGSDWSRQQRGRRI